MSRSMSRVPVRPRPPSSLELASSPDHDLADEATYRQLGFEEIDLSGQEGEAVEFEQCRFRRATLAGARLDSAGLTDCRIEHCDWANLRTDKAAWVRVEAADSRFTGVHWVGGSLTDVSFTECRMDLATLRFATLRHVAFVRCNLVRADFTNADVRGVRFTDCDLSGAQFAQANTEGTIFSGCDLSGLGSVTDLRGATIAGTDLGTLAHTLAAALGIIIAD